MAEVTTVNIPQGDFVTTTLNGAISSGATNFTIGTGLTLDANGGFLQINYDSTNALGASDGPETVAYTGYVTGTGAVTGVTRAQGATTAVAHSNGATVQCGTSSKYLLNGNVLGYAQITTSFTTTATPTATDVTSLATTVTVPAGSRRVKITAFCGAFRTSAAAGTDLEFNIQEGATGLSAASFITAGTLYLPATAIYVVTPTPGSHTYKVTVSQNAAGTITVTGAATQPAFILVELI